MEREEKRKKKNESKRSGLIEQEKSSIEKIKPYYTQYFKFEKKKQNEKIGIYLECAKNHVHKEFKMKNSNTSGLKKHLKGNHKSIFQTMFPVREEKEKDQVNKQQLTLDKMFSNVSIRKNVPARACLLYRVFSVRESFVTVKFFKYKFRIFFLFIRFFNRKMSF